MSITALFEQRCGELADKTSFLFYRDEKWQQSTWSSYYAQVQTLACWLQSKGVKAGDRVAILSANRPEWMIADMAILWLGAASVPIYATSHEKDVTYIAKHSGARVFFVDHSVRAQTLKNIFLDAVVLFDPFSKDEIGTISSPCFVFHDLLVKPQTIARQVHRDDDIATIVYTSGTTGEPKGVVHSFANIDAVMKSLRPVLAKPDGHTTDRFFSFLPLSHVAERVLVQMGSILTGSEVAFARSVSTLGEDLVQCRPTILLCVPRLWEKMHERILSNLLRAPRAKRVLFAVAKWLGRVRIRGTSVLPSRSNTLRAKLSDALVGSLLRKRLGLDRARLVVTGSAPTRAEVVEFFASFGLFIREVYGLTENLCLGVYQPADEILIGSCGKAFDGNEIKIADDGEVEFRAPWLFKEYYQNPTATADALKQGWFATGDLGRIDERGYLFIVGRKKELLKTSTGKYVAPVPIEDKLKALPVIQEAMIVGDNEKYCIALITLEPSLCRDNFKNDLVQHLNAMNEHLAHHESVKRLGVLQQGFSVEAGTLTPTLKLKRNIAFKKHQDFIKKVYDATETVVWE